MPVILGRWICVGTLGQLHLHSKCQGIPGLKKISTRKRRKKEEEKKRKKEGEGGKRREGGRKGRKRKGKKERWHTPKT